MIRKHPILTAFLILLAGAITAGVIRARQPKAIPVRTTQVERKEKLTSVVVASGEIRAHEMVDIQTEIAGVIVELPVKEGQKVTKGDVLLRIDPFQSEMEMASQQGRYEAARADVKRAETAVDSAVSSLARARQQVKTSESDLAQAQIQAERDGSSLKRYVELVKTRAISQDEFENFDMRARISVKRVESAQAAIAQANDQVRTSELAVETARVQQVAAQHNLAVAEAALKRAQDQLKKTTILSPINGVIVGLNVDIGERAVPGIQSNPQATLMTLANMAQMETELKVPEVDITRLKLGQKAKVTVDALEDTSLTGTVSEISAMPIQGASRGVSQGQESKDFKVVIVIDNPPPSMRIGMMCEAEIRIETRQNVLAIPIMALTNRSAEVDAQGNYIAPPKPEKGQAGANKAMAEGGGGPGKNGKKNAKQDLQGVYVKGADGMAHFRVVKTGIMGDMDVEVTGGLKENEEVITGPLQSLRQLDEWTLVRPETDAERASGGFGPRK